jgi:type IV pilus assembly protein PilQ
VLDPMKALEQAAADDPGVPAAPPSALAASQGPEPAPAVESAPSSDAAAIGASRAPAPLTFGQAPTVTRTGERTFSGHPVSLDFQGADLRAVLRTFAEISGLNIVIDPAVQGSVDVALRDVPWDQALDIILRANKLGYFVDGTIVRVAPLTVLAEEEKQRRKLAEEQALSGELRVMTKALSYARAEEVSPLITKSALTPRGTVQVDPRTNTLIISDLQQALDTASTLIATLDQPQPQVEIEARIVQTNSSFLRDIGVSWGFNGEVSPRLGNTTPLAFPNRGALGGATGGVQGTPGGSPVGNAVDLGVPGATSAIGLALGSVNGAFNLDLALSALERTGRGRILSTPRVSTQNNIEAEITQGVQIPIQTVANNTVTVTFKDAALTLKVTPQITTAGTVIMKIVVENAQADFSRSVNGIPPIDTQRALTQVLVSDGQTTVIGGIYLNTEQQVNDRTPALHRLPLLGWLFRKDRVEDSNRELLIFVTPRIIRT